MLFRKKLGGSSLVSIQKSRDWAVVTGVSGAPSDSSAGTIWFHRGTAGLQKWLFRLWQGKHHYYLGEWHFHPNGLAYPSHVDIDQMHTIATAESYRCPEPILLLIGGDPQERWEACRTCLQEEVASRRCIRRRWLGELNVEEAPETTYQIPRCSAHPWCVGPHANGRTYSRHGLLPWFTEMRCVWCNVGRHARKSCRGGIPSGTSTIACRCGTRLPLEEIDRPCFPNP